MNATAFFHGVKKIKIEKNRILGSEVIKIKINPLESDSSEITLFGDNGDIEKEILI